MSLEMYKKLKLNDLNTSHEKSSITHCDHYNQLERSYSFRELKYFLAFKGLKAVIVKQPKKSVVPVATVYA